MNEYDYKGFGERMQNFESPDSNITVNSGFLPNSDSINYVFRAAESSFNSIKSEAYLLERIFGCKVEDLTSIVITNGDAEEQIEDRLLDPVIDLSYSLRFAVGYDKLKMVKSQIFKIKNTDILFYFSQVGWICRRSDLSNIQNIFENFKLTPSSYNQGALDKVFWTDKTLSLKRDIEFFSMSKKWFDQKDLPYSRSYLLYGPPGNGKTSVIRAISEFFHAKPESFSFTAKYDDPDTEFNNWVVGRQRRRYSDDDDMHQIPRPLNLEVNELSNPKIRILLLEDVDRFFSKDSHTSMPVSFSTILNALDGVVQRKNSIIIATANNPEKIDSQVLCRPGRFDLRVPFEAPTEESIKNFILKISSGDIISDFAIERVASICKGHSLSFVKGIYLSAANRSFSRSSLNINDEDIISAAEEFSSNLGREIKSIKPGAGF